MHLSDYLCRVGFHAATKAKVSPTTIDATKDKIAMAMAMATKNDWPTEEKTSHPIFCDRGRRSLRRGVQQARLWLSRMDAAQAKAELLHVIGATVDPIRLTLPTSSRAKEGWHTYLPAWDRPGNPIALLSPSWSMRQTKSLYVWSLENRLSQQAAEFYPASIHTRSADDARRYGTVAEAATAAGVPRTTLVYAVEREEVPSKKTFGGTILVAIADAKKWAKNRPKPGRKSQG